MNEPLTAYITAYEVMEYTIKFPSGKVIRLTQGGSYTTEDKDELDFLSKQQFVGLKKMNDKEFRIWATKRLAELPSVYNQNVTEEVIRNAISFTQEEEQAYRNAIKEGYINKIPVKESINEKSDKHVSERKDTKPKVDKPKQTKPASKRKTTRNSK